MMANKKIHFNAFVQNSPSPYSSGLWKHEKDVEIVGTKPICLVAAAIADTNTVGSWDGNCTAYFADVSNELL